VSLFLGVVTLVLVMTCANIAGLLLARSTVRRRDIAVRFAIGASRGRIVSQVLTESLVLAALGGLAGLVVASWGTDLLGSLYSYDSAGRPLMFDLTLNVPVVVAAVAVTLLTAIIAGGLPAWHAGRTDLIGVLKDEGASGGARRARLRPLLVSAQVAVSVVLLVGATLMIESASHALGGPGFDADRVITLRSRPSLIDYSRERAHTFQREVIRRLEAMPGVVSASPSVYMSLFSAGLRVTAASATNPNDTLDALSNAVGPRYFETLGVPLVEGREFSEQERAGAAPVVIVNDVLARRLWPAQPAAGAALVVNGRPHTIVGVVRDAQYYAAGDQPRPQVFSSYWQSAPGDAFLNDSRTFVRVAGDPARMLPEVLRAIAAVDPAVPISEAHPLGDRVAYMFMPVRMARGMLTSFALLALILSAVGLYGVLAFSVAQRSREIGLRIAIGATRRQIATMVLREGMIVTAIGVVVGVLAASQSLRFASSLLFGLEPGNVTAFLAAPAVLVTVALVASYLPARRASNVSPLTAMRVD
jgi:predicted permease